MSCSPGEAQPTTLCRFALDDFAGDAAFFSDDKLLISTLHNSILVFPLPSPSSTASSSIPLLHPFLTIHAPARPLLWTSRFSQHMYNKGAGTMRLAGGSLLGQVLIWDLDLKKVSDLIERCSGSRETRTEEVIMGKLSRLNGHRGAIFTVSFSPEPPNLLASGSDDRTVRIWDLSSISTPASSAYTKEEETQLVEKEARILWGHEGRVWRIEWVDEERLVSVGEDATCRLWRLSSRSIPSKPQTVTAQNSSSCSLLQTWRDGHDGRSIWSANVARVKEEETMTEVALTGGADGAIRSWILPSTEEAVLESSRPPVRSKKTDQGSQIKSFVVAVDPSNDQPVALSLTNNGSFYLSTPSTPLQEIEPFHSSPSFANTATSLHLFFESANVATLQAFNNRGNCLFARFSISPSGNESTSNNPSFTVDEISELNFGIKAVSCTFDEDRTRLAVWGRASWKIHVCSLSSSSLSDSPTPLSTIDITPSSNGSTAPTSILFVDESLVLIGSANGRLSLHSLDSLKELASIKVHSDGVSDLRGPQRVKETNRWEIESIGRDGMRKLTEIRKKEEGQYELKVLDERCIAKGTIEKILVQENGEIRYLALVDTRAAVFDSLGRLLYAFDSPAKQSSSQFLETRLHGSFYYCVIQGKLTEQRNGSQFAPSSVISPGLHGREVRAVKMQRLTLEGEQVTIVASAAENGVLAISQLHRDNSLRPLYINRYLPSSLKSLTFSSPSHTQSTTTLYACGTRELLTAFEIDVVRKLENAGDEGDIEVRVLEGGIVLADVEGGEVRTMDISLIELEKESLVVAGYSDGKLKLWRHSGSSFELVGETEGLDKCVLSVEVAKVFVDGQERVLVISGQSDGRIIQPSASSSTLPEPFYVRHPHQSGINGLSVSSRDSTLLIATAGDDNAVTIQRVELTGIEGELKAIESSSSVLADAHGSTIQGLDFLSPSLLASSSVEQRLNFYAIVQLRTQFELRERMEANGGRWLLQA
ncbi:tRNA (34-2'-O)-methyltransferase regulator RTT10 [Sporobolomyces salmoneus]|uniref:tRNA (34-2'-O)-methyltransferase regulator RTT10 n=1 Tax=Sporobolomyces salmoneus TaxID=183962 RepID=UPI00317004B9